MFNYLTSGNARLLCSIFYFTQSKIDILISEQVQINKKAISTYILPAEYFRL